MKHTESLAVAGLIFTVITIRDISCGRQKCLLIVVNYFKTNENISHFLESNFTSGLKREKATLLKLRSKYGDFLNLHFFISS